MPDARGRRVEPTPRLRPASPLKTREAYEPSSIAPAATRREQGAPLADCPARMGCERPRGTTADKGAVLIAPSFAISVRRPDKEDRDGGVARFSPEKD